MKWIIACCACLGVGLLCGASPKKFVSYSYQSQLCHFQPTMKPQTMLFGGDEVVGAEVIQTSSGPAWVVLFRAPKE